jgi:hypothetical protein
MAFAPMIERLGATGNIQAAQAAPSAATDGYETKAHRYVNVSVHVTVGTSVDVQVYLYTGQAWVLYTDVPTTTVTAANGGGVFQLEMRGYPRIAVRVTNLIGAGATANVFADGVTY